MRLLSTLALLLLLPTLAHAQAPQPTRSQPRPAPDAAALRVETVATGLEHPWGLAFLPDGRMLVTERPGALRLVAADGKLSPPLPGTPEVAAQGQGGLLDIALAPDFATSRALFLSFAEPGPGGTAGTAVARASFTGQGLADLRVIYRQEPKVRGSLHFGSRLVFARDGTLFVTQGDRYSYRDQAQDLASLIGKIVRINPDGSIPPDNPFVGRADARPEIWSYGHRNIQGAALDPSGALLTVEHGARGGDELNRPLPGRNYGWPVITYGVDYSGARIGTGTAAPGMEQPLHYWDPSIAPSGLAIYTGAALPNWRGDLLVGALRGSHLARLVIRQGRVVAEYRYLEREGDRIRDVRQGPDGFVYLLTDSSDGRILRLRPR